MEKIDLLKFAGKGGCASKIPAFKLEGILKEIPFGTHPDLIVGNDTADDASVWKINDDVAIIQTTDFFPPLCSDPYEFGQIAAANSLSDVYAMGGKAISALNLVMYPASTEDLVHLKEILRGANDKAKEGGVVLTGGHSIDDAIPKFGLAVTGLVHPDKIVTNGNAKVGDVLILTKPLGTNQVITAYKKGQADQATYQRTLDQMKKLNDIAAMVMNKHNITSGTDVTGFGFAGHLKEMAKASNISFEIDSKALPIIEGAEDIVKEKYSPCSLGKNLQYVEKHYKVNDGVEEFYETLILDPQTSGGILMSVPEEKSKDVLQDLHQKGIKEAKIVGRAISNTGDTPQIILG